ncbi:MAG: ornithine cyclodeaminase family protein [Ancalomicrobiaceae bacterium]|nr:ornithine cyclodeaminase family protein [Ancalomicrobiaceae bacterium]
MRAVGADELIASLDSPSLIAALADAFREGVVTPLRHHHTLSRPGEPDAVLLMMPAWSIGEAADAYIGVKLVTVVPGNAARGVASVQGSYVLMSGLTGEPLAILDGTTLTLLRTAAASALAARSLARADAARLVMIGAGAMAPHLIAAHASVRPIREVVIWNRDRAKAEALAARLAGRGYSVTAADDLDAAVASADIVSAATMSRQPLVRGRFLKPGTHVDLVGAYTPEMRESDDAAVARARVFVDTREGATHEAGDIVQPLNNGTLTLDRIEADLFDFAHGRHPGRGSDDEITLFKSVGTALEDLAAARLAWERLKPPA